MATNKTSKIIVFSARLLLGLIFLIFGLNFFIHFLPSSPPDPASKAGLFLGGLFASGYFFVLLKVLEIVYGLLLLADLFTPLILILLFPISIHILLFHAILAPSPLPLVIAVVLFTLNSYLAWIYRSVYAPLFQLKQRVKPQKKKPDVATPVIGVA